MNKPTKKGVACHEAGHAVIFFHFGLEIVSVSIKKKGNSYGETKGREPVKKFKPDTDFNPETKDLLKRHVMSLLAGDIALKLFTGKSDPKGSSGDREKAEHLASYINGSDREIEYYLKWLSEKTKNCVNYYQLAVEPLAKELIKREKINGKRVKEVIIKSMKGRSQSRSPCT